jgi:hypothetical protein
MEWSERMRVVGTLSLFPFPSILFPLTPFPFLSHLAFTEEDVYFPPVSSPSAPLHFLLGSQQLELEV